MQRLVYIKSRSYSLYHYVFDTGPNKHDILIGLLLPQKSQCGNVWGEHSVGDMYVR